MNKLSIGSAIILLLAGGVVATAFFRSRVVKYINANRAVNTVNPTTTTVVDGQAAPARGPVRVYNGPVDFTVGSDILGGYGGSTRMQKVVTDSRFTSPQYVRPATKGV